MLIRIGYDSALRLPFATTVLYVLHIHPLRTGDLVGSEDFRVEPELSVEEYFDGFGNHCGRVNSPGGLIGRGRDAGDVPITMMFGHHLLETFCVITEEIDPGSTAKAARLG